MTLMELRPSHSSDSQMKQYLNHLLELMVINNWKGSISLKPMALLSSILLFWLILVLQNLLDQKLNQDDSTAAFYHAPL
ncbi:LOW QUALITY PROTEIN: hypothetical protein ACHAXS_003737 [Conticribra weissflogii]